MEETSGTQGVRPQTTLPAGNEVIGKIGNKDITVDDLMKNIGTKSWQGRQLNKLSAFFTGSTYIGNKDVAKLIQNSNYEQLARIQQTMDHVFENLDKTEHPKLAKKLTNLQTEANTRLSRLAQPNLTILTGVFKNRTPRLKEGGPIQQLPSQEEIAAEMHRQSKVDTKERLAKLKEDPQFKNFYEEMLAHSRNADFDKYIEKQDKLGRLLGAEYNSTLVQGAFKMLDAKFYSSNTNEYDLDGLNEQELQLLEDAYNEQKKFV